MSESKDSKLKGDEGRNQLIASPAPRKVRFEDFDLGKYTSALEAGVEDLMSDMVKNVFFIVFSLPLKNRGLKWAGVIFCCQRSPSRLNC